MNRGECKIPASRFRWNDTRWAYDPGASDAIFRFAYPQE